MSNVREINAADAALQSARKGRTVLGADLAVVFDTRQIDDLWRHYNVVSFSEVGELERLRLMAECIDRMYLVLNEAYAEQRNPLPHARHNWRLTRDDIECVRRLSVWMQYRSDDAEWLAHGNRRQLADRHNRGEHVDESALETRPKPPEFDEPRRETMPDGFPQLEWSWTEWVNKLLANRRRAAGADQRELEIPDLPDEEQST